MKGLIKDANIILFAENIEWGVWDEPIEKWALFDSDDNVFLYAIDDNYELVDFGDNVPDDYEAGKYLYVDGEFALNPDYSEPPIPIEDQVSNLSDDIQMFGECLDEIAVTLEENADTDNTTSECLDELVMMLEELMDRVSALENN